MTDLEIAIRAATNVLRDSVESGRMPSGEPLEADAKALHAKAADLLGRVIEKLDEVDRLAGSLKGLLDKIDTRRP